METGAYGVSNSKSYIFLYGKKRPLSFAPTVYRYYWAQQFL